MKICSVFLFILHLAIATTALSNELDEMELDRGTLIMLAPPGVNKDYFDLELGFVTDKEFKPWSYEYNAYVTASLFQDSYKRSDKYKAAGLGFKGGLFLPTQKWVPFMATVSVGYAKAVLHKNPIFGREPSSKEKKNMLLIEAGGLFHINKTYFVRYSYQLSNVKFFKTHALIMLGVTY